MWLIGPIGFAIPGLLLALVALPALWILLRAVPPAPIRRRFPGVALLLGLDDEKAETDRTPWWLLLLRMLAVAAAIVAFAGPVLHPDRRASGSGPLLVVIDGTWADARDWPQRMDRVQTVLTEAGRAGRPVAVVSLTGLPSGEVAFQTATAWTSRLSGLRPMPWVPDAAAVVAWANTLTGRFDSYWISDGLAHEGRAAVLDALQGHGAVTVWQSAHPVYALRPAVFKDGKVEVRVARDTAAGAAEVTVVAHGPDPGGTDRDLARATAAFKASDLEATAVLDLPSELRNRVNRFEVLGQHSAGAVSLTDDALKRRKVALIAGVRDREGLELLSPLHYLREALKPSADVIEGNFTDLVQADPNVIILADVAKLSPEESATLLAWVNKGGMLLRFAGPRMAESDISRDAEDPLMPVRLRVGGREVGGAMSWGQPKLLRPFPESSPFYGLTIPPDVTVNEQVMAQPDPTLAARTIASLADGTPLVTRKAVGRGAVVLFHVTANAEWSTLPLSGLFVQMLDRLAVSTRPARPTVPEMAGTTWVPLKQLDGFGVLHGASQSAGVAGEALLAATAGPKVPPGIYGAQDRRLALNVVTDTTEIAPAVWPRGVVVEGAVASHEVNLKGGVLVGALVVLLLDLLASLWLSGRLRGLGAGAAVVALALSVPGQGRADDAFALQATHGVVLAHVLTGDARVDQLAQAGLLGLSSVLTARTSVEPDPPMAVNIETDDLSLFPFLYWPITATEPLPSQKAYAKLNDYLRSGGMILFDTRDADLGDFGAATPNGQRLQAIAVGLDIPPLEVVPKDHVLTRSFYLLQDFPGRFDSRNVWIEAAPPGVAKAEGMPFRDLNDGVSPVVIGGNDWASAWAVDANGASLYPVGRGNAGERQREISYRFGINLIMYVLTGNYKSDQVHVPALLQRLGQ